MTRATACAGLVMTTGFGVGDGAGLADAAVVGDAAMDVGDGTGVGDAAMDLGDGTGVGDAAVDVGDGAVGVGGAPVLVHALTSRAAMTNVTMDADRRCVMAVRRSCAHFGSIVRHPKAVRAPQHT